MIEKLKILGFMAAVAAVLTALVATVHLATRERVALNREMAEHRAALVALGVEGADGADGGTIAALYGRYLRPLPDVTGPEDEPVLEGLDDRGGTIGYVFKVGGRGFWDDIRGYVAVARDGRTIRGVRFHSQNETPGLGAEITAPWFQEAFKGRVIPDEPQQDGTLIEFVPRGRERAENEVHAITGATGTTSALKAFLNRDVAEFRRAIRGRLQTAAESP